MIDKLMSIDRRVIFILVALSVIIPTLIMIRFPIFVSKETRAVYDYIDELTEDGVVMIAFDYSPSSFAELQPMAIAILNHCFTEDVKVIGMTLWPQGATLGHNAMQNSAKKFGKVDGEDYVYLGYRPGYHNVVLRMGENISAVFEKDFNGKPVKEIPMMQGIKNYEDIDLLVDLASGSTPELWITYAYTSYQQKIAAGVTGVMVSQFYPYIQTGQLIGLMPGMLGGAEYETMVNDIIPKPLHKLEKAIKGMSIQSIIHLLIISLVIIGNIAYFLHGRRERLTVTRS